MQAHPLRVTRRTILAFLTLAPCAVWAADAEPTAVVKDLIAAMASGDADRIRTAFADDASQAYGSGSQKSGDAFRAWLESDIIDANGRVDDPEFTTDGTAVMVNGTYRNDNGYSSQADFLFERRRWRDHQLVRAVTRACTTGCCGPCPSMQRRHD